MLLTTEDDRAITPNSAANRYDDGVDDYVHYTINLMLRDNWDASASVAATAGYVIGTITLRMLLMLLIPLCSKCVYNDLVGSGTWDLLDG